MRKSKAENTVTAGAVVESGADSGSQAKNLRNVKKGEACPSDGQKEGLTD